MRKTISLNLWKYLQIKIIKKGSLLLIIFAVLIVIILFEFLHSNKPNYEGDLQLKSLSKPATTYFNTYGITHIYAANEEDTQRVLGYAYAQERLWQMELLRRIAPRKLLEIFGIILVWTI